MTEHHIQTIQRQIKEMTVSKLDNPSPPKTSFLGERWIGYESITLIPRVISTLEHRVEADTSIRFGNVDLSIPMLAAPMPDVCNGAMSFALNSLGALGIIHRFQSHQERIDNSVRVNPGSVAISINESPTVLDNLYNYGARIFCIDTANGASVLTQNAIQRLKDKYHDIFIIAGNIASPEAFRELEAWGADAIRVGIAGGSVCETRTETGVYSPMATVVHKCAQVKKSALLIADGGIKTPSDMCKALVLGADVVMVGGVLAGTDESPGEVIKVDGRKKKLFRGAASFAVQRDSGSKDPVYVEGTEALVDYKGEVSKVVERFRNGLRSSMSYMNARTLEEYRQNATVVMI